MLAVTTNLTKYPSKVQNTSCIYKVIKNEKGAGLIMKKSHRKSIAMLLSMALSATLITVPITAGAEPAVRGTVVDEDHFVASSSYTMAGDTTYANKKTVTGVFGREDTDYSFDLYTQGLPAGTAVSNRYNFMAGYSFDTQDTFTREFSIGADGYFDAVNFLIRCNLNPATARSTYLEAASLSSNGTVKANGTAVSGLEFRKNQWYRMAITVYPQTLKYDLYFNGTKIVDNQSITPGYSDGYSIASFDWFQIQPVYNDSVAFERDGNVYIDDTVTYMGTYVPEDGSEAKIQTEDFEVKEGSGIITVPKGTDIYDFDDCIEYGDATLTVYTDDTYSDTVSGKLKTGNMAVVVSPNGIVYNYYAIILEGESPTPAPATPAPPTPSPTPTPVVYYATDFNDGKLVDGVTVSSNATWSGLDEAGCGKFAGDKTYHFIAKNGAYAEVSFSFDYYKGVDTLCGDGSIQQKTLEFSMLYDNIGDCELVLHGDIARNKATHGWAGSYDYLKIQSGKVYAISGTNDAQTMVDTGITVDADKWYRVALEYIETSSGRNVNVYFNGQKVTENFNTGGNSVYDKSTVLKLKSPSTSDLRSVYIDDVAVYEGFYNATADTVEYSSDTIENGEISVQAGTTADTVLAGITTTGDKFVISKLTGVAQTVTGEISNGNLVVIKSPSGKSFEYINLDVAEPDPTPTPEPGSNIYFETDFNDGELVDGVTVSNNAAWTGIDEPGCGKISGDKAYHMAVKNASYAEASFAFDFYKGVDTLAGGESIQQKTLELSFLYNGIGDCELALHGDIARNASTHGWAGSYDYLKVQSGKLYAISGNNDAQALVDTGISLEENKWYRAAVEYRLQEGGRYVNVYFNGQKVTENFNTGGNSVYDKSTVLRIKSSSTSTVRNLFVDDVAVYAGLYDPTGDTVEYSSSDVNDGKISTETGTGADTVLSKITTDGDKYVIEKLTGVAKPVTGNVSNGNIIVVKSPNGKGFDYITIDQFDLDSEIEITTDAEYATATVNMYVPVSSTAKTAVLAIASYDENGSLTAVNYEEYTVMGGMMLEAYIPVPEAGSVIKAMLWDQNMKPYLPQKVFE